MEPRPAENRPPFGRPARVASGDDAFYRSLVDEFGETIAPLTGEALFRSAVRYMSRALGVQAVFIAECVDYPTTRVRILAEWDRGRFTEPREFALTGTPCDATINEGRITCLPDGSRSRTRRCSI